MTPSQTFSSANPPETLCLLRLSALGDITHVLPTLRTLQKHWPTTKITWIIGKSEYQLVKAIDNINFASRFLIHNISLIFVGVKKLFETIFSAKPRRGEACG